MWALLLPLATLANVNTIVQGTDAASTLSDADVADATDLGQTMAQLFAVFHDGQSVGSTGDSVRMPKDPVWRYAIQEARRAAIAKPSWSKHSQAKRDSELRRALHSVRQRRAKRRGLQTQSQLDGELFDALSSSQLDHWIGHEGCEDPLATNTGSSGSCVYICEDLQVHYFPDQESSCFLHDTQSGWPNVLLDMRQQYRDTHSFDTEENATGAIAFTIGEGRECTNVTIITSFAESLSRAEILCLVDGEHEHEHTVSDPHTVEVVGYVESGLHESAGGVTTFVVGECTDVHIRVTTTMSNGAPFRLTIQDNRWRTWEVEVPAGVHMYEYESCMFDNDYVISKSGAGASSWQGFIEVVGFAWYHNTIEVPPTANWIIQGSMNSDGLPALLDARISSGSAVDPSQASIVVRYVRFSGRDAPLDPHPEARDYSRSSDTIGTHVGGAFKYDGGGRTMEGPQTTLEFDHVVFDHNSAVHGGGLFIDGRAGAVHIDGQWGGVKWTMNAVLFFRNHAEGGGGGAHQRDVWPLSAVHRNVDWIENTAGFSSAAHRDAWSPNVNLGSVKPYGFGSITYINSHYQGIEGLDSALVVGCYCYFKNVCPHDDATLNVTFISTTMDHCHGPIFPALAVFHQSGQANFKVMQFEMSNSGPLYDSWAHNHFATTRAFQFVMQNSVARYMRVENSGTLNERTMGNGVTSWYFIAPGDPDLKNWAHFEYSEFSNNAALTAPGVEFRGEGDSTFYRCVFRGNRAYLVGGALRFLSQSIFVIRSSVFEDNVVATPTGLSQAVTVRVWTGPTGPESEDLSGGSGQDWVAEGGTAGDLEFSSPIWRIDDGPVYGIPFFACSLAAAESQRHIDIGVNAGEPDFPTNLRCMNETYVMQRLYSHTVELDEGEHTLHTGIMQQTHMPALSWDGGWMDIVGKTSPIYPLFQDYRPERFFGCALGIEAGQGGMCPKGSTFWTRTQFNVFKGTGGAIAGEDAQSIIIRDSLFRSNYAPAGQDIAVRAARFVRITNTTFNSSIQSTSILAEGSEVENCVKNPCKTGERCLFRDGSTFCSSCSSSEVSTDGIVCSSCTPGRSPNTDHTACERCPLGTFSTIGQCFECSSGQTSTADRSGCTPCPTGTHRLAGQPTCVPCQPGTSPDAMAASCLPCLEAEQHSSDGRECQACPTGRQPTENRTACEACQAGTAGAHGRCEPCGPGKKAALGMPLCESCPGRQEPNEARSECRCKQGMYDSRPIGYGTVRCEGDVVDTMTIDSAECSPCPAVCLDCISQPGLVRIKPGWALYGSSVIYRCPFAAACHGVTANVTGRGSLVDVDTCATGYQGPTCANCVPGFNHYKVGGSCDPCDEGVINIPLLIGAVFIGGAIIAAVLSGAHSFFDELGLLTDFRIIVGLYQILGQAAAVLNVSFPSPVPELIDVLKLLFLDVRKVIRLDCWDIGGFYGKMITNVFLLPVLFCVGCLVVYYNDRRMYKRLIKDGASGSEALQSAVISLKRNLLLGIFLMYPMITTTLFRIPQCRQLGTDWYHEEDYTVDCTSSDFVVAASVGAIAVLVVPVGVPVLLYVKMRSQITALGGSVGMNSKGGAKLVADDVEDDADPLAFLVSEYRPEFHHYEIVTYCRKMVLNGITVLVGRGTMGQVYFGIFATTGFLLYHLRSFPYALQKHNVLDTVGQSALLLMYSTTLLLRNTSPEAWEDEWVPKEAYGWFIAVLFLVVVPAPVIYSVVVHLQSDKMVDYETREGFDNPLHNVASNATESGSWQKLAVLKREIKALNNKVHTLKVQNSALQNRHTTKLDAAKALAAADSNSFEDVQTRRIWDARRPSQVKEIKDLVEAGLLYEDTMNAATESLNAHFRTQIGFDGRRDSLRAWLEERRLLQHENLLVKVGGLALAPEDLKLFRREDIETVCAQMTYIEGRRFTQEIEAMYEEERSPQAALD